MEKTIAVVVTYNREKLLANCIDALRNQTRPLDQLLVINNGSTDNTEKWLAGQDDIIFISQENIGSAGGFNTGIEWAYKNGYSWIWCMDDDGYPKEDALEELLKADTGEMAMLNCAVLDKEDKQSFVWKTSVYKKHSEAKEDRIKGVAHPFNGTLLHRKILERVGLPHSELFLWGDETEYLYRITRVNKIPCYTITKSIHYHPRTAFSIMQDWDFSASWKMYFYVRNRLHVHKAKFSSALYAYVCYFSFVIAFMGMVVLVQKTDRRKKLKFVLWPTADAIFSRFEATPVDILKKLKTTNTTSSRSIFNWMPNLFPKKYAPATSS